MPAVTGAGDLTTFLESVGGDNGDRGVRSSGELLTGAKLGRGPALRVNRLLRVTNAGEFASVVFTSIFSSLILGICGGLGPGRLLTERQWWAPPLWPARLTGE